MKKIDSKPSVERVYTKLKFTKSELTGSIISFVSRDPKTGQVRGVRKDDKYPKMICLLDKNLKSEIILNTLYDVTLIPMAAKNGYVVIEASPTQFKAVLKIEYIPKSRYEVTVSFGNKSVLFDPLDGKKKSVRNVEEARKLLETSVNIKDITQVISDFNRVASNLISLYEKDGFIYPWG